MDKTLAALFIFVLFVVSIGLGIWGGLTIGDALVTGIITWKTVVAGLYFVAMGTWFIRGLL